MKNNKLALTSFDEFQELTEEVNQSIYGGSVHPSSVHDDISDTLDNSSYGDHSDSYDTSDYADS